MCLKVPFLLVYNWEEFRDISLIPIAREYGVLHSLRMYSKTDTTKKLALIFRSSHDVYIIWSY